MKKYLISTIVLVFISQLVFSQGSSKIIGKHWAIDSIIRIEVLDNETHMPIKDAIIGIDERKGMLSLNTNSNGVAIIIIKQAKYFQGGKLKVTANRYNYYEELVGFRDYVPSGRKQSFAFFGDEINMSEYHSGLVSDSKLISAVNRKSYQRVGSPTGFPIVEQTIYLEKVSNRDRGGYEDDYNDYQSQSDITNGWRETKNDFGEICYIKGNVELTIIHVQGEYIVAKGIKGESRTKYIDAYGNYINFRKFSKSEAERIAKNYMDRN